MFDDESWVVQSRSEGSTVDVVEGGGEWPWIFGVMDFEGVIRWDTCFLLARQEE